MLTVLLTLSALGGWEGLLRARGFEAGLSDGFALWTRARARVSDRDPRTFVFAGSSVIQAAISLDGFERAVAGSKPVQLALTGSSPLPVLEDLAEDERFRGVVVAEYSGAMLLDASRIEVLPQLHLEHHRRSSASPFEAAESQLDLWVDARVVLRRQEVAPAQILLAWRQGTWPLPALRVTQDRELVIRADSDPRRAQRMVRRNNREWQRRGPLDATAYRTLEHNLARVARSVETLRQRGAATAFVFLRCEGPEREITERRRLERWGALRRSVPAVYLDIGDLLDPATLPCPDGAHLLEDGRERVTRALARALAASFPAHAAGAP